MQSNTILVDGKRSKHGAMLFEVISADGMQHIFSNSSAMTITHLLKIDEFVLSEIPNNLEQCFEGNPRRSRTSVAKNSSDLLYLLFGPGFSKNRDALCSCPAVATYCILLVLSAK